MKTLLFGAGHQAEQARKRRKNRQQIINSGAYITYSNSSDVYFTPATKRRRTFPLDAASQASTTVSNSTANATLRTSNLGSLQQDRFQKSPEPSDNLASPAIKKRKAAEMEMTEIEEKELVEWARKPKRRLTLDPLKKDQNLEDNKRIQEARAKCEALGLKYKDE